MSFDNSKPRESESKRRRIREGVGGIRCAAWGCSKTRIKDNVGVFRFPDRAKSPERHKFWCKLVSRTRANFVFHPKTSRLCADHFEPSQIANLGLIRHLESTKPEPAGKSKWRWRLVENARPSPELMPKLPRHQTSFLTSPSSAQKNLSTPRSAYIKLNRKRHVAEALATATTQEDFAATEALHLEDEHLEEEFISKVEQNHFEDNMYEPVKPDGSKRLKSIAVPSKIFKKMPGRKKASIQSIDSFAQLVHHEHLNACVEYQRESCMSSDKESINGKVDTNKQPPRHLNLESSKTSQILMNKKEKDCLLCNEESACELHQKYLEKVSTEQKIFQCSICNKTLSCKSSLRRHLVSHGKSKEFKCPHCNKEFFGERELKTHIKIHVPGKKKQKANLRKQKRKQNSMADSQLKEFICLICDDEFSDELCLHQHMQKHNDQIIDVKSFLSSKDSNIASLESDPDVDPLLIEDEISPVKEEVPDSTLSEETSFKFNRKDFIGDECLVKTEIDVDGEIFKKNICDSKDVDFDFVKVEEFFEYDHKPT